QRKREYDQHCAGHVFHRVLRKFATVYNGGLWTEREHHCVPFFYLFLFRSAAATRFVEAFIEPRGTRTSEGPHHMGLTLFNGRANAVSLRTEHGRLLLDLLNPIRIEFSDVHVNAHLRDGGDTLGSGVWKIAGQASYGQEILRIQRGDVKGTPAAVRHAGNVK